MGFLKGVLESVKDENVVTTYDKYISDENNRLNKVLEKLQSSIGTGRDGLAEAVTQVREWLEGYGKSVKQKCEDVKTPLGIIKIDMESFEKTFDTLKSEPIEDQYSKWKKKGQLYSRLVKQVDEALKMIDSRLSGKLKAYMKQLWQSVNTFQEAADNRDLHEINILSFNTMLKITESIGIKFYESKKELNDYLHRNLENLRNKLRSLRDTQFSQLVTSVTGDLYNDFRAVNKKAEELEVRYKSEIITRLSQLKTASNDFNSKITEMQGTLKLAIEQVESQLGYFAKLEHVDRIASKQAHSVLLLKAFGDGQKPFDSLKKYFAALNGEVISLINAAMTKIGKGWENVLGKHNLEETVTIVDREIQALKMMFDGTVPSMDFNDVNAILGSSVAVGKINLSTHASKIDGVVQKLDMQQSQYARLTKGDSLKVLVELGAIAEDVSEHSGRLVSEVMDGIEKKIRSEIGAVAGAIHTQVKKIDDCIKSDGTNEIDFGILGGIMERKACGLKKLVVDFKKLIETEIGTLQGTVGEQDHEANVEGSVYSNLLKMNKDVEKFGNTVDVVKKHIEAVSGELFACVNAANKLLAKLPRWSEIIVDQLRKNASTYITEGFKAVQEEAKTLYINRKKSELENLHQSVRQRLIDVTCTINKNLNTGLKGFLKTLSGNHIDEYAAGHIERRPVEKPSTPNLLDPVKSALDGREHGEKVKALTQNSQAYFLHIFDYLHKDLKQSFAPQPRVFGHYHTRVTTIRTNLTALLDHITKQQHFDHQVPGKLETLKTSLTSFTSSNFGNASYPVLDAFPQSLVRFVGELERMYIGRYEGQKLNKLVTMKDNKVDDLTPEGKKLSKVCLTLLEILYSDFSKLRTDYSSWYDETIHLGQVKKNKNSAENITNPLGTFFADRGYKVANDETKQHGELRNKKELTGREVYELCVNDIENSQGQTLQLVKQYTTVSSTKVKLNQLLYYFHQGPLYDYYRVCHLNVRPNPKLPTTIYEMLHWLNGLYYNPIYKKLEGYMETWFNEFLDEHKLPRDKPFQVAIPHRRSRSMLRDINFKEMHKVFINATIRANDMLIAVLGHGQPDGMYACDFYTNPHNLLYPSRDSACFDLLVEVCLSINHQIRFLYRQCHNGPSCGGWRDCHYGKGIGGSRWQCNDLQCPNQECDQKHTQMGEQHPNCGVKSPLQSFLEDGLVGFLPHQVTNVKCGVTCSLSNHRGIPCKTPMGFSDLGIKASHTKKGAYLKELLEDFCGSRKESLNLFCSYLLCLLRRPPQTLCDMFSFYYNLLDHWCDTNSKQKEHRRDAFEIAVRKANLGRSFDDLNPTTLFRTSVHKPVKTQSTHEKGDLFSLLSCNPENAPTMPCGRYLQSIGDDIRLLFYKEQADLYLSWMVYQAETFYDLLEKLYKEVSKNCDTSKAICYGSRCNKDCPVKHPFTDQTSSAHAQINHKKDCNSIVNCSHTHQTLYTYGFTFGSPHDLSGANNALNKQRTCKDFCAALKSVLNKEKKAEAALAKLIYDTIPKFLWEIRQPFSYLVLALWSASFLYLLYVYIGRLDTLHIRSHLRIPASHKIAAQSLLAAARIGNLAKISYLQP